MEQSSSPRLVRLLPKTRHLENRIKQHGDTWLVIDTRGDELLIESLNDTFRIAPGKMEKDLRWVKESFTQPATTEKEISVTLPTKLTLPPTNARGI